ncbi:hypothetical protein [Cryptosporangium arvum]|jgi:hypothetical protein|uniref:hypothetical protein n=1 Tax=Cryptosporangium arvum TaxID=80871 RepID=UPI0004B4D6B7|nr:hypothetical protein [Cryptosporangium arvum]
MRLIIELSQTPQGRLEGSVARPDSVDELQFEGIVELVGVLEQHLRAPGTGTEPG